MKNKLLFVLSILFIMPCMFLLSACGGGEHIHTYAADWSYNTTQHYHACTVSDCSEKQDAEDHTYNSGYICTVCNYTHTHSFELNYIYNANNHWRECATCDATSAILPHDYTDSSDTTCNTCEFVRQDAVPDDVATIRDLEVVVYQTNNNGVYTIVKLPDGKTMLIDSGYGDAGYEDYMQLDRNLITNLGIETLEYLVLTNTLAERCGNISTLLNRIVPQNAYIPDVTNAGYTPSETFTTTVNNLTQTNGCTVHTITQTNQTEVDITRTFTYNGTPHTYTIDFITPLAPASCTTEVDASIYVAIEYQGTVILLTGDPTDANIDSYAGVEADPIADYDVDVLVTGYHSNYSSQAITHSGGRGSDFLGDISLTSDDYVVVTNLGDITGISTLHDVLEQKTNNCYALGGNNDYTVATIKINSQGAYTVTTGN